MRLNKQKLKQIIQEVLDENITDTKPSTVSQIQQSQRSTDAKREVGKLAPRERQVIQALGNIQTAMSKPGNQATQRVVALLQRLVDELKKGEKVTTDAEANQGENQ